MAFLRMELKKIGSKHGPKCRQKTLTIKTRPVLKANIWTNNY